MLADDVEGNWNLELTTDDGKDDDLAVELYRLGNQKPAAIHTGQIREIVSVTEISLAHNAVKLSIDIDFEGTPVTAIFEGHSYRDKRNATIKYTLEDPSGENDCT